jgi:hypothetical protein
MNNISDFAAHKRDEEFDRLDEARYEMAMAAVPRCPIHGSHFVMGCGVAGEPTHIFPNGGGCPTCYWESRRQG